MFRKWLANLIHKEQQPNHLPGINIVITAPNMMIRNTIIKVVRVTSGIVPSQRKDTESAKRAMYPNGISRTIINTSSAMMRFSLGYHRVCAAVDVDSPTEAAFVAEGILKDAGLHPEVHLRPEPEFPEGFITFVSAPELDGIVFLFWPKNPDKKVLATLAQAFPWLMEYENDNEDFE